MEDPRVYSNYDTVEDQRPTGRTGREYGEKTKNLYDSMINMIVNHKMELQKIPQCSALPSAQAWAQKRGLRAGQQDFDGDGIPEIVVYNKAGQPMIINGYRPKPSDFAIRQAYWTENPTIESRIEAGPMRQWVQEKAYKVTPRKDNIWKRTISTTDWGDKLKESGYKMPTKPKKAFSVFSVFSKLIAPYVRTYLENGALIELLGSEATPACATLLKKLISPISMYRMLFMKCVERYYFFTLLSLNPSPLPSGKYVDFKKYVKKNPNAFWTFFKANLLTQDMTSFKPNIINDEVVARLFVKDEIDWDGNDKDDAILFLMGAKNITDDNFAMTIRNGQTAGDFLAGLKDSNKKVAAARKKELEKWKKNAQQGTKEFFSSQQQYLFENEGALARFQQRVAENKNPIDPSDTNAAPSSPTKTVENKDVKEEKIPDTTTQTNANTGEEDAEEGPEI